MRKLLKVDIQEKLVPVSATQGGVKGFRYKDTTTGQLVGGFVPVDQLTPAQTSEISKYIAPDGAKDFKGYQGYKLDPNALSASPTTPKSDSGTGLNRIPSLPGTPERKKLEAEIEAANRARREAEAKAAAEEKPEAKPEAKPKPAGQKLVWNKERMDFDTPDGKPAPYPKVEPKDIDIRGLSAYRPGGALPRLSSTGVSASSSPTPTATDLAPAAPKPEGVSAGLKKWASIYGPGGPKELKQPTPSQRRLFNYTHPSTEKSVTAVTEAYDVVLDYLLSEGHADTVEEAHYVMMQLDSEYVQSIVEGFPGVSGRQDPGEKLKLHQTPGGRRYYTGPGGREMNPDDVNKVMRGELMVKKQTPKPTTQVAHYELEGEEIVESPGEWFRGRLNSNNSVASQAQRRSPFTQPTKPLPSTPSPFAKPASRDDSGKLTTYGAGGGAEAERRGKTREQVMKQGAENLENKKRTQPVNQGPDFGR